MKKKLTLSVTTIRQLGELTSDELATAAGGTMGIPVTGGGGPCDMTGGNTNCNAPSYNACPPPATPPPPECANAVTESPEPPRDLEVPTQNWI